LTTRNDTKRRDATCGYAEGVDGINTRTPLLSVPQTTPVRSFQRLHPRRSASSAGYKVHRHRTRAQRYKDRLIIVVVASAR
jgi:hypothetical protein